jgi:hypothetical protein
MANTREATIIAPDLDIFVFKSAIALEFEIEDARG